MQRFFWLVSLVLGLFWLTVPAQAQIRYTVTGIANGQSFSLTGVSSSSVSGGSVTIVPLTGIDIVYGSQTGTISTATPFFLNVTFGPSAAFDADNSAVSAFLVFQNPGFGSWDGVSAFASRPVSYAYGEGVATSFGVVNFSGASNLVFSASAAPEPGTWAMMILGFGLVGWALRRRRDGMSRGLAVA